MKLNKNYINYIILLLLSVSFVYADTEITEDNFLNIFNILNNDIIGSTLLFFAIALLLMLIVCKIYNFSFESTLMLCGLVVFLFMMKISVSIMYYFILVGAIFFLYTAIKSYLEK